MIPVVNIGRMVHRGTIQAPSDAEDGAGGKVRTWVTEVLNVSMDISPIDGNERVYGMQLQTRVTHQITMRYRSGMTTQKRILCKGVAYNIRHVGNKDLRNKVFTLLAEEGVAT